MISSEKNANPLAVIPGLIAFVAIIAYFLWANCDWITWQKSTDFPFYYSQLFRTPIKSVRLFNYYQGHNRISFNIDISGSGVLELKNPELFPQLTPDALAEIKTKRWTPFVYPWVKNIFYKRPRFDSLSDDSGTWICMDSTHKKAFVLCYPQNTEFIQHLQQPNTNSEPKVGFLIEGEDFESWVSNPIFGVTTEEEGLVYLQKSMQKKVEIIYAESIFDNDETERRMEEMVDLGCKLIFAPSYRDLEPVLKVAARHPDVIFMQANRLTREKNVGSYFPLDYEAAYLAGVAAGRITKSNKLGFIGSHPLPPVLAYLNAYALGVHSVNPKTKIRAVWTNTWFDNAVGASKATSLIDSGVDVLAVVQDGCSPIPIFRVAKYNNIKVVDTYRNVWTAYRGPGEQLPKEAGPDPWLTGTRYNWGPFYTKVCQAVIDHNWKNDEYICDMKSGVIDLGPLGPSVPLAVQQEVLALKEKIKTGKLVVFEGPITDSTGNLKLQPGQKADIQWLSNMNFFVPGIDGEL